MPIEIPSDTSAPVYFPKENYKIARYFDLVKFLSLLQTKNLFFSRLDKFEDKYEGTYPELNNKEYKIWYTQFLQKRIMPLRHVDLIKEVDEVMKDEEVAREKIKSLVCVSCWNKYESESYALWKIYSHMSQGIMITSTIKKIISAFKDCEEKISMSEVRYVNFKNDKIKMGNMYYPIIHKNVHYDYEKEVRLLHTVNFGAGLTYDWNAEESNSGKYMKIDLNELIDEVIISPHSQDWFYKIIEDILLKYDIKKEIKFSDLR